MQVISFDFDGTLSKLTPERYMQLETDPGTFIREDLLMQDPPNEMVIGTLREYASRSNRIIITTGRPTKHRWQIERWLRTQIPEVIFELYPRSLLAFPQEKDIPKHKILTLKRLQAYAHYDDSLPQILSMQEKLPYVRFFHVSGDSIVYQERT